MTGYRQQTKLPSASHSRSGGFTLVELMVTLAVVAILATIGVPSYQTLVNNNRLTTQANSLVSAMNFARSEAIKRSQSVTVADSNGDTAWAGGWVVRDANGNILRTFAALEGQSTLTGSATSVVYRGSGFINATTTITFSLCDNRTGETGRTISISTTGRVNVSNLVCS